MADQSASVFGSGNVLSHLAACRYCQDHGPTSQLISLMPGCYRNGSAKITMGTGSFLDVVTDSPHASLNGLIPLVAWRRPAKEVLSQIIRNICISSYSYNQIVKFKFGIFRFILFLETDYYLNSQVNIPPLFVIWSFLIQREYLVFSFEHFLQN